MEEMLLSIRVTRSDKNREYWATREWVAGTQQAVRKADVLVVPWEDFREHKPALFPQGTPDFYRYLLASMKSQSICIAIDEARYEEISLHAKAARFPTLLLSALILPAVAQVLGSRIDQLLSEQKDLQQVELKVIVEDPREKAACISIEYKGPPGKAVEAIIDRAKECGLDTGEGKGGKGGKGANGKGRKGAK